MGCSVSRQGSVQRRRPMSIAGVVQMQRARRRRAREIRRRIQQRRRWRQRENGIRCFVNEIVQTGRAEIFRTMHSRWLRRSMWRRWSPCLRVVVTRIGHERERRRYGPRRHRPVVGLVLEGMKEVLKHLLLRRGCCWRRWRRRRW